MSDFESLGEIKPPDGGVNGLRELIRWVYTNNPFYLISAALVFYGLRVSFDTRGSTFDVGSLMLGLVGYTLLLAGAAWFLIRFGKLWEDARSLLLLVVFMLLAISVSFDDTLAGNSRLGIPLFLGGLLFAVVLSEGLLRGIGLRLPAGFRWPYYAALSLFFLYPIGLGGAHLRSPDRALLFWGLFGFSTAAGGVALMLWPAIRRGPADLGDNGSPWPWPWYPWTLFGMLGFGAMPAGLLPVHFVPFRGRHGDHLSTLLSRAVPVGRQFSALGAGTHRRPEGRDPAGVLLTRRTGLAFDDGPPNAGHGPRLSTKCSVARSAVRRCFWPCAPLPCSMAWPRCGASPMPGMRWPRPSRRLPSVAATHSTRDHHPASRPADPGCRDALSGDRRMARPQSAEWLLGGWGVVLAAWVSLSGTAFGLWQGAIPLHLLLVHALVVGAVFHDPLGKLVQAAGTYTIFALSLVATQASPSSLGNPPAMLLLCYPFVAAVAAAAYGLLVRNRWYYAAATGTICIGWPDRAGTPIAAHGEPSAALTTSSGVCCSSSSACS